MTLHRFFEALGISSIHWYVNQSDQKKPPHEHIEENWVRTRDYILSSGYRAFSDYPTRTYYRELAAEFPDAFFILSTRKDVEIWRRSMLEFFAKFDIPLQIDKLAENYIRVNEKIRRLAAQSQLAFLEVCIDDGAAPNSNAIKKFLGVDSAVEMGWENKTAGYDNTIISRRASFFNPTTSDVIAYTESLCRGTKAMPSERGWLYLVNDANDFLRYQFGESKVSEPQFAAAVAMVRARAAKLEGLGIAFRNIIVPEKSVVYREFLPIAFDKMQESAVRPAPMLAAAVPDTVHYLADYIKDLKSYGLLYFRGDTHANWLGAFFAYRYLAEQMNRAMQALGKVSPSAIRGPIPIAGMASKMVDYDGDLRAQLLQKHADDFASVWKFLQPSRAFERLPHYFLPPEKISTKPAEVPDEYLCLAQSREIFVREHKDRSLPRAVVFRDSTADFMIDLLAEHFSRSVFIWYKGLLVDDVIEREKPDIVLHLSAERFVWIYSKQPSFVTLQQVRDAGSTPAAAIEEPPS